MVIYTVWYYSSDVVQMFGIESIYIYTALLLKKRVAVYAPDVNDVLKVTRYEFLNNLPEYLLKARQYEFLINNYVGSFSFHTKSYFIITYLN